MKPQDLARPLGGTGERVWAPRAQRVELLVHDGSADRQRPPRRVELGRDEAAHGWWVSPEGPLPDGSEYAFALDGGEPLPDPRSAWQPAGVFGASRRVDPARFRWTDVGWQPPALGAGLVYELHVGTFSEAGTFAGAVEHLDHLVALGVSHVELMPVAEFPGRFGWGYDGVDLFAPAHAYGGPDGLAALVDACHARGLAVLVDVVHNHLGPHGNVLPRFGPYLTDRHRTLWGDALNLDGPGSDEVRAFLIDSALAWLRDYHADGLRLDAVQALFDVSATHYLEELGEAVHELGDALGRPLVVVAESDLNDPRLVRPPAEGGYGLDAQWSDDFHHALWTALTDQRERYYADFDGLPDLATALESVFVYAGRYSAFRDRRHGRGPLGLGGDRFLGYLQTHDQVGNAARGDRASAVLSPDALRLATAVVLTGPFVPLVFQGEEWAASAPFPFFADHLDPALAAAVREGRRAEFEPFGWPPEAVPDPVARETFEAARLDWTEPDREPHAGVLAWYRHLAALRAAVPDLRPGPLATVRRDDVERWLVVERGACRLAANVSAEPRVVPVDGVALLRLVAASGAVARRPDGALDLGPSAVALLVPPDVPLPPGLELPPDPPAAA